MRMAILALAGLLILGGGGAGAYFFFMKPAQASVGETAEHMDTGEAKAKKGKDAAPTMQYVELDPLILPIIDKRGVSQTLSLIVMLEVANPEAAEKVSALSPRLTDAYIQDMYGMLNKHEALQDGVVQVGLLKERLNGVTQKVMGEGTVNDVLLQVVQQRRM